MTIRRLPLAAVLLLAWPAFAAEPYLAWQGWIVGEPCARTLSIADCPLRHVERPVLLAENGQALAFLVASGGPIRDVDVDKNYGKKVRITGRLSARGVIEPIRLDALEQTGERKFFKGCL